MIVSTFLNAMTHINECNVTIVKKHNTTETQTGLFVLDCEGGQPLNRLRSWRIANNKQCIHLRMSQQEVQLLQWDALGQGLLRVCVQNKYPFI